MQFQKTSVCELLKQLKKGTLTSKKLVEELLERCLKLKEFNYLTYQDSQTMLEQAAKSDKRFQSGTERPFEGIPVCVKDNIDTIGAPTTAGSPAFKGHFPKFESQIWYRLKYHGAINAGKTNMNELALGTSTYNGYYGTARNAYDFTRIAGGSSGGTGGLVGTGAVPIGLGTDHSGSIRIPSAFNGIVGYKPTVNRWPCEFGIKASHIKDTAGPMAICMDDIVLIDEIITEVRHKVPPKIQDITLGVPYSHFFEDIDPQIHESTQQAIKKLKNAGVKIIYNEGIKDLTNYESMTSLHTLNFEVQQRLTDYMNANGIKMTFQQVVEKLGSDDVKQVLKALADHPTSEDKFLEILHQTRKKERKLIFEYFEKNKIDAIIYPSCAIIPPKIDELHPPDWKIIHNGRRVPQLLIGLKNADIASSSNSPAITLPFKPNEINLPVGIEISALTGEDEKLIAIARTLEKVLNS